MRNSIWDKWEGLSKWDVNLLSLLVIEVSGWFGGERGTHLPIIPHTWFICKCLVSSMITEDKEGSIAISHFKEYKMYQLCKVNINFFLRTKPKKFSNLRRLGLQPVHKSDAGIQFS